MARLQRPQRADLHIHTRASDGEFTPTQVVAFARQAGLCAAAITDHDTLASVEEAKRSAGDQFELIPGVEISATFAGREVHLLGYFVRLDHWDLNARLAKVCESRRHRFREYIALLAKQSISLPQDQVLRVEEGSHSLGRRHVASLLSKNGAAKNRTDAFHRFLGPLTARVQPKLLIPIEEALDLVHKAGGVASLAHPSADLSEDDYASLAGLGLTALEIDYPWGRNSPCRKLLEIAERFGFARTGGSDCHGQEPPQRKIGSHGICKDDLGRLRVLASTISQQRT
jgi:predicted metal-dependent phosphoesterase TrpH